MDKFSFYPSKTLIAILIFLHLGGVFCIISIGTNFWLSFGMLLICVISFIFNLQKSLLKTSKAIITIWQETADSWCLKDNNGKIMTARLLGSSFASNLIIVLHFKVAKKKFTLPILIFKDALDKKMWRKLRILLTTSF